MKENVVTNGLKVENLLQSLQKMISSGVIDGETIVVIDTFDGYRHGVKKVIIEEQATLTISAKLHEEVIL